MGIRPQKNLSPDSQFAQDALEQTEIIFQDVRKNAMQAYIKYKANYDEKPMPQNWNKPITSLYYSQKQIIKGVKFLLQIFSGLDHILLKRCYPTIIVWYAKLALIRRKFFIEWGYDKSHLANRYQTYQSHHANGNQTPRLSSHITIFTLEQGSVNMMSQYLTAITITWQHLVHPKLQYDPNIQLMKWRTLRESYQEIPQKICLSQMDHMTEGTWITTRSLMRIRV